MSLVRPVALPPVTKIGAGTIFWCAVAVLGIVTTVLFGLAPKPALGIQPDEGKKATFILGGDQDFRHPILMLNLIRFANLWTGATEVAAAIDLGRVISSAMGGLTAVAAAVLARRVVPAPAALCAGLLTALAPLTVFHAQIVKEDIFVAPFLLFGLLALDRLRETLQTDRAILFGVTVGLATSAKYAGAILLPLAVFLPLLIPGGVRPLSLYYRMLAVAVVVALAVFVLINAPLAWSYATFARGLSHEVQHSMSGHLLRLPGWYTWFAFYLREGLLLWPQAPFTLAGVAGAAYVLARWRVAAPAARLVVIFGTCWYFAHELSPMKPFVGPVRHMTVLSGIFGVLAVYALTALVARLDSRWQAAAFALVIAAVALPATLTTVAIARTGNDDTRFVLSRLRTNLDGPLFSDLNTVIQSGSAANIQSGERGWAFAARNRDWTKFRYLIISDHIMHRFLTVDPERGQKSFVRRLAAGYQVVAELPALQIRSVAGSFSHRNTPLRIVLLGDPPAHLDEIIARAPAVPTIEYRARPGVSVPPAN